MIALLVAGMALAVPPECWKTITVKCSSLVLIGPLPDTSRWCEDYDEELEITYYTYCGDVSIVDPSAHNAILTDGTGPIGIKAEDACAVTWRKRVCTELGTCTVLNPPPAPPNSNVGTPISEDMNTSSCNQ